jgi:RNA polymerase sigma factor (sigma-70 family)
MFFKRSSVKDTPKTDAELIALYQKTGELVWVGELYERYTSLVYGICLKYLKDREESQDQVMEVFEKLIHELRFREVTHFKSWLHVLVRNECLMRLRSRKRTLGLEEDSPESMENHAFLHPETDEADREMILQILEKGMEHLSPEQKICVELFYLQNKSYKEVCEITGFDLNKVKSYIQNGKRNLKIFVENNSQ